MVDITTINMSVPFSTSTPWITQSRITFTTQGNVSTNNTNFYLTCDLPFASDVKTVAFSLGMILMLLISVIGNLLVLLGILMSPSLKHRITSLFITSLACSDMAFALLMVPFKISMALRNNLFCHSAPACYWYLISDTVVNTSSMLNLLIIAIDRLVSVVT